MSMSERDWEEEQRSVLGQLFDSLFGRREASEDEIDAITPDEQVCKTASNFDPQ
jgi:hypothetical protein